MAISDYLTSLVNDRDTLVANLTAKGITGLTGDETFTELVPEVLNIPSDKTKYLTSFVPQRTNQANTRIVKGIQTAMKEVVVKDTIIDSTGTAASGYTAAALYAWPDSMPNIEKITFENVELKKTASGSINFPESWGVLREVVVKNFVVSSDNTNANYGLFGSGKSSMTTYTTIDIQSLTLANGNLQYMFQYFKGTSLDLSHVIAPTITSLNYFCYNCTNLTSIDMSAFDFSSSVTVSNAFGSVPANCIIYVKDAANQAILQSKFSNRDIRIKA